MEESISGTIERVTFHNPDNGFAVLRVVVKGKTGLVTVVGWHGCDHLGPVYEGDTLHSTISVEQVDPLPAGGGLVHLRSMVRAEAPRTDGAPGWARAGRTPSGLGWPGGSDGRTAGDVHQHEGSAARDVLDWRYIAVVA